MLGLPLIFLEVFFMETIKDIMTKDIISVLPSDTVEDAAILMEQNDIGSVPVVSGGELKGLLTDRDIVLRCISKGNSAKSMKVSELMSTDIAFLTPEQTLYDAANIMAKKRVRRLPVLNKGYVDGMVSLADIAKFHQDPEIASAICEVNTQSARQKSTNSASPINRNTDNFSSSYNPGGFGGQTSKGSAKNSIGGRYNDSFFDQGSQDWDQDNHPQNWSGDFDLQSAHPFNDFENLAEVDLNKGQISSSEQDKN